MASDTEGINDAGERRRPTQEKKFHDRQELLKLRDKESGETQSASVKKRKPLLLFMGSIFINDSLTSFR